MTEKELRHAVEYQYDKLKRIHYAFKEAHKSKTPSETLKHLEEAEYWTKHALSWTQERGLVDGRP